MASVRLENDPAFKLIKESSEWLSKQNDKQYSLQMKKYRTEQQSIRSTIKQLDVLVKLKDSLDVSSLSKELNRYDDDKNKKDRFTLWLKGLQQDIYLDQAIKVMNDMIGQENLAKAKAKEEPVKKAF